MEGINDLKLIKKHYNEKMAHLCRELFPTILEKPGLLYELMIKNFEPSKTLYEDIMEWGLDISFKNYIYSRIDIEERPQVDINKTPAELLDEAGYTLYECKTEADIQKFKKYYAPGEELCTFSGGRLERCHVFFAVKKNVDDIKRKDFIEPNRQDKYGTSVMSIQFAKDEYNTLSIKNRYNHTVDNPDATFSNNLENIAPGLTESFNKTYGLNSQLKYFDFEIPGYVQASDGKFYKYNIEDYNIYYCANNVIIENFKAKHYDKAKYIVIENFILDLVNKKLEQYDTEEPDSFPDTVGEIETIKIKVNKDNKTRDVIINDSTVITLDSNNRIIKYENSSVFRIPDEFLNKNVYMEEIDLPNVRTISDSFLYKNLYLKRASLPKVSIIGDCFLTQNQRLKEIDLPNVESMGDYCLRENEEMESINLPKIEKIGESCLEHNEYIKTIKLPRVRTIEGWFLSKNRVLEEIEFPNVTEIGCCFLMRNQKLKRFNAPYLRTLLGYYLCDNTDMEEFYAPRLRGTDINPMHTSSKVYELIDKSRFRQR